MRKRRRANQSAKMEDECSSKDLSILNSLAVVKDIDPVHCSQCSIRLNPVSIDKFESAQYKWKENKPKKKSVRKFYKKQDDLIQIYKEACKCEEDKISINTNREGNKINLAAKLSFVLNLILFIGKLIVAVISGSFSILSSVVDSAVDLISGVVIWYTNRAIKLTNIYRYPIGRKRLEPLAVLVLSCIMAMASVLVVRESLDKIISGTINIDLSYVTIVIIIVTILCKLFLYLFCRSIKSPSTNLLALDHRNDVISNSLALVFGVLGDHVWSYMDPIGAIVLSVYLFASWWKQGSEQIRTLSGHVAPNWLLKEITWVCLQHSIKITGIDTITTSSIGVNFLVEVHIVLPPETSFSEAHDIGESLQLKLEAHNYIERAFVHVDYDSLHHPSTEHIPVLTKKSESESTSV